MDISLCNSFKHLNKNNMPSKIILTLLLIIAMITGTVNAYAEGLFEVRVVTDGDWKVYNTIGMPVSEFFEKKISK